MRETDHRNGTLVIEGLKSLGEYQFMVICKAESKGGKATANASIQILGRFNVQCSV